MRELYLPDLNILQVCSNSLPHPAPNPPETERPCLGAWVMLLLGSEGRPLLQSSMDNVMGNLPSTLQQHLLNCGVVRSMFLPSWLMTVFSVDLHISVTGRLLDVMLVEGWRRPLLATAATFITVSQPWIEQMKRMESVVDVLKVCRSMTSTIRIRHTCSPKPGRRLG